MTQGLDAEQQEASVPLYQQLALWMSEQARWVSLPQLMSEFGLSRTQVYSHLATLRKNVPDCMEEKREQKGALSLAWVRVMPDWQMPVARRQVPSTSCHYISSPAGMVMPTPKHRAHCCWLQLTQRPWKAMRLERSEVGQILRMTKKIKEGAGGGDNQGVSDISGYF